MSSPTFPRCSSPSSSSSSPLPSPPPSGSSSRAHSAGWTTARCWRTSRESPSSRSGIFAALSQLQIAPAIVTGLFYAILAVVAGSLIIAVGGGGIQPMQERWRNALAKYDDEKPKVRQEMQGARDRIAARTEQLKSQAQSPSSADATTGARALRPEGGR